MMFKANFQLDIMDVYELLGSSNLDYVAAISELIDNSYSAATGSDVNIKIRILGNWKDNVLDLKTASLIIEDDGKGIEPHNFGACLTPGKKSDNPGLINQFGAGLKNSLMTLGCTKTSTGICGFEIVSKSSSIDDSYKIDKISTIESVEVIPVENSVWAKNQGTRVKITGLKSTSNFPTTKNLSKLKRQLGMRYRLFLDNDPAQFRKMNLSLSLEDMMGNIIKDTKGNLCFWDIKALSPIYSITNTTRRTRFTSGTGNEWIASVKVNYLPSSEEAKDFVSEEAKEQTTDSDHPYYYHDKKVDIIANGIVIQQMKFAEFIGDLESSNDRTNRAEYIHMEVVLEKGFSLINTKNGIKQSAAFQELREKVKDWLKAQNLKGKKESDHRSEKEICEHLHGMFVDMYGKDKVNKELSVRHGKRPDFRIDDLLIEVKKDQADTNDVMQLINYCILEGNTKAKLIANGFTDNAKNCASSYLEDLLRAAQNWDPSKKIDIQLAELNKYLAK